jgi:hypothetical protein
MLLVYLGDGCVIYCYSVSVIIMIPTFVGVWSSCGCVHAVALGGGGGGVFCVYCGKICFVLKYIKGKKNG